jgi:hypothetical protein
MNDPLLSRLRAFLADLSAEQGPVSEDELAAVQAELGGWGAALRPGPVARMFMLPPESEMRRALQHVRARKLEADPAWREFMGDIAVRVDRIERQAIQIAGIALREDLWPDVVEVLCYRVVRVPADSPVKWGVIT